MLMLALPALAWACIALTYTPSGPAWRPAALLVGVVAAGILALADLNALELEVLDPLLGWSALAAAISLAAGWGMAVIALIARRRLDRPRALPMSLGATLLACVVGIGLYGWLGQPGFYGDGLFVILKDQADLAAAANVRDLHGAPHRRLYRPGSACHDDPARSTPNARRLWGRLHPLLPGQRAGSPRQPAAGALVANKG